MRVIVYHGYYGCESGCCGHIVDVYENDDNFDPENYWPHEGDKSKFDFDHPGFFDPVTQRYRGETPREFAERIVREKFGEDHVKDLDWEHCLILED
jgi:hypothetical protein